MKYAVVIPSVMTLLVAALSMFFLSCDAGDASLASMQQPMFASAPGSPVSIAGGPNNVLLGDMNKDGKTDLVVACDRGNEDHRLAWSGRWTISRRGWQSYWRRRKSR